MGYIIKDATINTHYFGASDTYKILHSDLSTSEKIYDSLRDVYSSCNTISLEDRELDVNEEIELSLLWKWVENDNVSDTKIGNYVANNPNKDIYYLTISFKFKIIDKGC